MSSRTESLFGGRFSTAITKYPTGQYGIVGSIPYELTEPQTTGTPQYPPLRRSKRWNTEQEAIDTLLAIGCERFQLADCSWYENPIRDCARALDAAPKVADLPFALTAPAATTPRGRQMPLFERKER